MGMTGLVNQIISRMTVNVGMDFAAETSLLPAFLQPAFVITVLGDPLQFRVTTYGFVASTPAQVVGDRPDTKRTPFVVRLVSAPEESKKDGNVTVHYSAWCVRAS